MLEAIPEAVVRMLGVAGASPLLREILSLDQLVTQFAIEELDSQTTIDRLYESTLLDYTV